MCFSRCLPTDLCVYPEFPTIDRLSGNEVQLKLFCLQETFTVILLLGHISPQICILFKEIKPIFRTMKIFWHAT